MAAGKTQGTLCSFPPLPLDVNLPSSKQGMHQVHSASQLGQCTHQNQELGYKGAGLGGAALAPPQNAPVHRHAAAGTTGPEITPCTKGTLESTLGTLFLWD